MSTNKQPCDKCENGFVACAGELYACLCHQEKDGVQQWNDVADEILGSDATTLQLGEFPLRKIENDIVGNFRMKFAPTKEKECIDCKWLDERIRPKPKTKEYCAFGHVWPPTTDTSDWRSRFDKHSALSGLSKAEVPHLKAFIEKELERAREEGKREKLEDTLLRDSAFKAGRTAAIAEVKEMIEDTLKLLGQVEDATTAVKSIHMSIVAHNPPDYSPAKLEALGRARALTDLLTKLPK